MTSQMRSGKTPRAKKATRSQTRLAETVRPAEARTGIRAVMATAPVVKIPAAVLLVGTVWLVVRLMTDARFQVRQVEIRGVQHLVTAQVAEMVDVVGRNIFLVRAQVLAHEVLLRYDCIETVDVRCRLPDRVTVTVQEKDVALAWQSGGRYWWLGPQGEVLGETDDPGNLVVVRDAGGVAPDPDGYVAGIPVALAQGLGRVVSANRRYDYTPDTGLVVYVTTEGWPVYLGHEGDPARKVALMRSLVDSLLSRGIRAEYIDLRNDRRPTYKPS